MANIEYQGMQIELDDEGYLADLNQWNLGVASLLAKQINTPLTEAHWELIRLIRDFYHQFDHSPAMRPFIKFIKLNLGTEKAKSIYLMKLFPGEGSPVKRVAQLAGLPKPDNCF